MKHVRPATFTSQTGNPFKQMGAHIAAEDKRRADGLRKTAAARKSNKTRTAKP